MEGDAQTERAPASLLNDLAGRLLLPKLRAIESIRADLGKENISVPGIVVAGDQSAGKSSLLERLCGINLPRGKTMTTRVPLIISLSSDSTLSESVAEISTSPDDPEQRQRLESLEDIPDAISRLTEEQVPAAGHVADKPIYLFVTHREGPTLTIIDLPGITRLDRDNKRGTIFEETSALVKTYITNPEMIILAVAPATEDLHNAEAIALARDVDPEGERTLGVLTKCDMTTKDTGLEEKLLPDADDDSNVRLELGFVGIRSRTQTECDSGVSLEEARRLERQFFESIGAADGRAHLDPKLWGMETLTQRIVELQTQKVDAFIDNIRVELQRNLLPKAKDVLDAMPEKLDTQDKRWQLLMKGASRAEAEFAAAAEGRLARATTPSMKVCTRAMERYEDYRDKIVCAVGLSEYFKSFDKLEMIRECHKENRGAALENFLNAPVFRRLVLEATEKPLKEAGEAMIRSTRKYVEETVMTFLKPEFELFPPLLKEVEAEVARYFDAAEADAMVTLRRLNESQKFIFTQNDYYSQTIAKIKAVVNDAGHSLPIGGVTTWGEQDQHRQKMLKEQEKQIEEEHGLKSDYLKTIQSNEDYAVFEMQVSLYAYLKVLLKRMTDAAPAIANTKLLIKVYEKTDSKSDRSLASHLLGAFTADHLAKCVVEDIVIARKRQSARERVERLERALKVVVSLAA